MKRFFRFLQIDIYFVLFLFLMSYVLVINSRIRDDKNILSILQPDAPIAQFFSAFLIIILLKLTIYFFQKKDGIKEHTVITYLKYFGIAFIVYMVASNLFSFIIATLFGTISRNFNTQILVLNNLSRSVNFILFGGLYLAYLFLKENNTYRVEINKYDKALSSSVIQQLKTQLNPHFLFNNLNTLDELIEEDRTKASAFLHQFSEIYRYSLITSEKKLVSLQDEIEFVKSYFKLMEHKYFGYYHLEIKEDYIPKVFVPPFCLQILVENAIEHNLGLTETPVFITISMNDAITVINNKIPKKHKKTTGGRALKNLSTQFKLLCGKEMIIEDSNTHFKVILPFLNSNEDV